MRLAMESNMPKHSYLLLGFQFLLLIPTIHATVNIGVGVGVILDMGSSVGKTSKICIQMAIQDFYRTHNATTTRLIPHFRDSANDTLEAASAAIELLKDAGVMAIIGPHRSSQADFVVDMGNRSKVPILSLATSPSLSSKEDPYFIRVSQNSSAQAQPIAALVNHFLWREVVFVYEQTDFGSGLIPYLSEALSNIGARIKHRTVISPFATDGGISEELHKLKGMETRVYVVHLLPALASRFFKIANEIGMMQDGYAWIITDVVANLLHTVNIDSMQGVLGVKPDILRSPKLKVFEKRWKRRFKREYPNSESGTDRIELDAYGLWSYDATHALAMAMERAGTDITNTFQRQKKPRTDLEAIGTSSLGPRLLLEMSKTRLEGLSGHFFVVDGQLQPLDYKIVSIIGKEVKTVGSWTWSQGIPKKHERGLGAITWPGGSNRPPQGWKIPATNNRLKVGFPAKGAFNEFINIKAGEVKPTGFCVDVFEAVMAEIPLAPPYKYMPFSITENKISGSYDELVHQIVLKKYDMVIGDVTIRSNRANDVDFTLPYTESGVSMIVPVKLDKRKSTWIFMKPLEKALWLTTGAFFIYTGVVVWVLEHRVNEEFRGRPYKQVGMIFWFSFSTLVFAHRQKMISNLARFVMIVWIFVVLVLQSSYIASLTSMLTEQQLQPDFRDIHDLIRQGDKVGCQEGTFVAEMLKDMGFKEDNLKSYGSFQQYDEGLSKGEVSAIFDELPYLNVFLKKAKYCTKYMMVGPTYKSAGFGFAFPLGSPLVPVFSRAILQVRENKLENISDKWFVKEANCSKQNENGDVTSGSGSGSGSGRLSLDSFRGLFLIAGISSTSALLIYIFIFLYENRGIMLASEGSIRQKLYAIATAFDQEKESPKTTGSAGDDEVTVTEDDITTNAPSPEYFNNLDLDAAETPPHHDIVIVEPRLEREGDI